MGLISATLKCLNLFSDRFQILQNLSKKYPNFYSLWFGVKYLFVTDDPSIAQKLLTYPQCVEKNFFMELFGFPNGLISLKCKWKSESCSSSFRLITIMIIEWNGKRRRSSRKKLLIKFFLVKFYLSADRWKHERKLLNSSFSLPILHSYIPIFDRCIVQSISHFKQKCDKGEFDIKHDITLVVMNAVLSKSNNHK